MGLVLLLPTAQSAAPEPVPHLVINGGTTQLYDAPPNQFQANTNLTWKLSPSDPNQVTGALNYTLYQDNTAYVTGWLPIYNLSRLAVPNQPGWVYSDISRTDVSTNGSFFIHYNLTVTNNAASNPKTSAPSCLVGANVYLSGHHDECGTERITAPPGIAAVVNATHVELDPDPGNVNVTWLLSEDDPNETVGNFTYRLRLKTILPNGTVVVLRNFTDDTTSADANGRRQNDIDTSGPFTAQFDVRAEDNTTNRWSDFSCTITVETGVRWNLNGCGSLEGYDAGDIITTEPSFPFLDVPTWQTAVGLTSDATAWLLGSILFLAISLGGWFIARGVGAGVGASLGICLAALFGLIPYWFIIALFGLIVVGIVKFGGGGQTT